MSFFIDLIKDNAGWQKSLSVLGNHDFTHTYDFHRISNHFGEGEPLAFMAREADGRPLAFWPVLKRNIPGSGFFDFTSVYGYAGPIVDKGAAGWRAVGAIFQAMRDQGAVSLFSRMHPLFMEPLAEEHKGDRLGEVVVVEVGESEDVLRGYRGSHRREITNALARGVTVSVEAGPSAVSDFHQIYHQAMTDLNARDYYFFGKEYFDLLENSSDFRTFILFANENGRKIASSIFIVTGNIMQYYLSGTVAEFRRLSPSKVILAEAHRLAVRMGLRHLVLGGGIGSGQDSLLAFKKGFSPFSLPFYVTRRVLDQERYSALCAKRGVAAEDMRFFPAYRA